MGYRINEIGNKYGRLLVTKYAGKIKNQNVWECICDCGNTTIISGVYLRCGHTQSCGCIHKEQLIARQKKYDVPRRLYSIWYKMLARCEDSKNKSYKYYGAKGITVCNEWHDLNVFYQWSINNGYSEELSIDRKDYNKGYNPENCRWVTTKAQQNNKSNNRYETINGITKSIQEWIDDYGVNTGMVRSRLARGWSVEEALQTPSRKEYRGKRVLCVNTGEIFESSKKAGKKYGVSGEAIRAAILGRSNNCCGMQWKYLDT